MRRAAVLLSLFVTAAILVACGADIPFDSGQLGTQGVPTAGRIDWTTPTSLPAGTYTCFCRIHPSMRGGFVVTED